MNSDKILSAMWTPDEELKMKRTQRLMNGQIKQGPEIRARKATWKEMRREVFNEDGAEVNGEIEDAILLGMFD